MLATNQPVPFFDWKALYAERADRYAQILQETAASGGFILHDAVAEFERALAAYLGVKHAIALSDCTNAMQLGLRASGIGRATRSSFRATPSLPPPRRSILPARCRCRSMATRVVDPDCVRAAITPRTEA